MNIELKPMATMTLPSDQEASGRTLGDEEIAMIAEAIRSGTLTSTKGRFTKELETQFAKMIGAKHCFACSSGSAAIHCAVAALDPEPGDEIITTSITDMGALTPILYQGAIPVFADVDPKTGNITAKSIVDRIGPKTKAIIATHLFGNPADMSKIMAAANHYKIPVIEDCAQAFLATHRNKQVGTFGKIGCFSLQQGKHITAGEGGLVVTDDDALARRMYLFINKAWGYGDPKPDHYFIALNYRMSELQGACTLAQLQKLKTVVQHRQECGEAMTERMEGMEGVTPPSHLRTNEPVYWKYSVMVDPKVIEGGAVGMAKALKEFNIASAPRYIQKPAFRCEIFRDQRTFGNSRWPFTLARPHAVDYSEERFPGTFQYLEEVLVLPWNENYTGEHLNYIGEALHRAARALKKS